MTLRIRQVVLAARDLERTVEQLRVVLGVEVCYRDPEVAKFGLRNALFTIGHQNIVQFLEVVSPRQDNTAAGRHLDRHGDSPYMLILQTDDLARDRARLRQLNVRIVWESTQADISAVHLHPKDIGAAIVSLDQPTPPESWRWAGPDWRGHVSKSGAQRVLSVTMAARDPRALAQRWAEVLGTSAPIQTDSADCIHIDDGRLHFVHGNCEIMQRLTIRLPNRSAAFARAAAQGLPVNGDCITLCGTEFELSD